MAESIAGPDGPKRGPASPHLLSARMGAVLSQVTGEIKNLYVVGLNAQLSAGRSSQGGDGFERISTRLYGLAQEISEAIRQANRLSVQVSRSIHRLHIAEEACRPLRDQGVLERLTVGQEECRRLREEAHQEVRDMLACLQGLVGRVEAAEHLAVNARVEASKARVQGQGGEFEEVAMQIRASITQIRHTVDAVRPDLEALQQSEAAA